MAARSAGRQAPLKDAADVAAQGQPLAVPLVTHPVHAVQGAPAGGVAGGCCPLVKHILVGEVSELEAHRGARQRLGRREEEGVQGRHDGCGWLGW